MKGYLHKTEQGWVVRWSDLHSFASGTLWMYTRICPDDLSEFLNDLINDKEVEFEYMIEESSPFSYAKIININGNERKV